MANLESLLGGAKTSYTMGAPLGGLMSGFASNDAEKANALEELVRRQALLKQQQENDRYGQITPFEVEKERTAGGLARIMGTPENLRTTAGGMLGKSNQEMVKGNVDLQTQDSQIASALSKNKLDTQKNTYLNAARTLEIPMAMLQSGITDVNTIVSNLPESERAPFVQLMKSAMASGKFKSPIQAIPMMHQKFNEMVSNIQQQSEAAQASIAGQKANWKFGGEQQEAGRNARQAGEIKARKDAAALEAKEAKEKDEKHKTFEAAAIEQERIMNDDNASPEKRAKAKARYKELVKADIDKRIAVAKLAAEAEAEWNRRHGGGGGAPVPQGEAQPRKTFNATTGKWEVVDGAL